MYQRKDEIGTIKLKNGVLQGDSLSYFLFILTLDPLIRILTEMKIGHQIAGGYYTDVEYFVDDLRVSSDETRKIEKSDDAITKYATAV